jgi:hypothetical protein
MGIKRLINLTDLWCTDCDNITDDGIKCLTKLVILYNFGCPNITVEKN